MGCCTKKALIGVLAWNVIVRCAGFSVTNRLRFGETSWNRLVRFRFWRNSPYGNNSNVCRIALMSSRGGGGRENKKKPFVVDENYWVSELLGVLWVWGETPQKHYVEKRRVPECLRGRCHTPGDGLMKRNGRENRHGMKLLKRNALSIPNPLLSSPATVSRRRYVCCRLSTDVFHGLPSSSPRKTALPDPPNRQTRFTLIGPTKPRVNKKKTVFNSASSRNGPDLRGQFHFTCRWNVCRTKSSD